MLSIKALAKAWDDFFFSESDLLSLCLFRIILGIFLLLNALSIIPDFTVWFGVSSDSLLPLETSLSLYDGFRINFFNWLAPTMLSAWTIFFLYLASSFGLMIGYKTKISAIFCFVTLVSLQNRNYTILNSGDTVLRCMLFPMMFAPSNIKFSLDSFIKRKTGILLVVRKQMTFLRLLQIQFSIVYLATTFFKMKGYDWVDGTAVYYTSRLQNFQRLAIPYLFDFAIPVKMLTWMALLVEFSMGTLVWIKECRKWVLLYGLALHLFIELTMSIGSFEWVMMGCYVLFVDDIFIQRFINFCKKTFDDLVMTKVRSQK